MLEWGFKLLVSQFCTNLGLNCLFFCGQNNLLGGQFRAMGRFNLLDGQSNLLGSLLHRPLFTKFFTPAEPLVSNHKTNHFPNYFHQGEKGKGRKDILYLKYFLDIIMLRNAACKVSIWWVVPFFQKQGIIKKKKKKKKKIGFPLKLDDVIIMSSNMHEWKGKLRSIVWYQCLMQRSLKTKFHPMIVRQYYTKLSNHFICMV